MRLDEAHLIVGGEPAELDAHDALDLGSDAFVGASDEKSQNRERIAAPHQARDELEAGTVAPLEAVENDDERRLDCGAREQAADAGRQESPIVRDVGFVGCLREPAGTELRETSDDVVTVAPAREFPERLEHDLSRLGDGLLAARAGELAHELSGGGVRQLARRGGALDTHDARVRRKLRAQRVDEGRLTDAHLPAHDAGRDLSDAVLARRRDGAMVRGVEIRELRVAPDEIPRRVRHLLELFLAREWPLEGVDTHVSRQATLRGLFERYGGRVAPHEVAPHETVETAGYPGLPRRRLRADEVGEVFGRLLERVTDEMARLIATAGRDAAHDADRRLHELRHVVGRALDGFVDVHGERRGVGCRPRRIGEQSDHCSGHGSDFSRRLGNVPRPASAPLERDLVENAPELVEEPSPPARCREPR